MTGRKYRQPPRRGFPEEPPRKMDVPNPRRVVTRKKKYPERSSLPARNFKTVVSTSVGILRRSGLKYVVTGGAALPYYRRVRTTLDVDIVVEYDEEKLKYIVNELNRVGFIIPWEWVEQSIKEKSHFTAQDKFSSYHLDIKILQPGEKLGRTVEVELAGKPMHITAPEDLIVHKLRFGGNIDVEDARSIIINQGKRLDLKYMLEKAQNHGVKEELIKLLREEGIAF